MFFGVVLGHGKTSISSFATKETVKFNRNRRCCWFATTVGVGFEHVTS